LACADFLYQSLHIKILALCVPYFTAQISLKNGFNQVAFQIQTNVLNSVSNKSFAKIFLISVSWSSFDQIVNSLLII
jgi:hypothetical protein